MLARQNYPRWMCQTHTCAAILHTMLGATSMWLLASSSSCNLLVTLASCLMFTYRLLVTPARLLI